MCADRVPYGDDPAQFVDVHRDTGRGAGRGPVVLLHGGFWRARVGLDHIAPVAADLHDRGHTVVNVEYRRVGQAPFPGTLEDVEAALRLVEGIVEGPALVVGHSAGGHLAAWVASRVPVAGVVSLAGVLTLAVAAREGIGEGAATDFVGGSPDQLPDRYALADPMAHLPLGVSLRAVHARADDRVPFGISVRYVEAATAAGDDAALVEVPGDHFSVADPTHAAWPTVRATIEELAQTTFGKR